MHFFSVCIMSDNSKHPSIPLQRCSLLLRLLAIGALLFGQLSFAGHYHDLAESSKALDDCAVCIQLHSVKNITGTSASAGTVTPLVAAEVNAKQTTALPAFPARLPPCRAPPLS